MPISMLTADFVMASGSRDVTRSDAAFRAYQNTTYFKSLDILRAFSIIAVVWHHTALELFAHPLAKQGYHGVTLFFAISGFLIVTLILREKERTGQFAIKAFYIKRTLRIFPLYYATLLSYVALVYFVEKNAGARAAFIENLPYFATFTINWVASADSHRIIFYFAWSLAAEEQFYLFWPWIERYTRGLVTLGIAVALVAITPDFLSPLAGDAAGQIVPLNVFARFPAAIGLGVVLAHLLHNPATFRWVAAIAGQRGSVLSIFVMVVATLCSGTSLGVWERPVLDALMCLLVAACVVRPDNDFAVLNKLRPLVWVGVVSYGMYLLHMLAVNAVKQTDAAFGGVIEPLAGAQAPLLLFVGSTLFAALMATLSYLTYERWFLGLKDRLIRRA